MYDHWFESLCCVLNIAKDGKIEFKIYSIYYEDVYKRHSKNCFLRKKKRKKCRRKIRKENLSMNSIENILERCDKCCYYNDS